MRVVDEDLVAGGLVGHIVGEKIEQRAFIGHGGHIWVGPISAPQDPVGGRIDQGLGEWDHIVEGRRLTCRETFGARDLHPASLVGSHEVEEVLKRLLIYSVDRRNTGHMVDQVRDWHLVKQLVIDRKVFGVEVQDDMPTERFDPLHESPERCKIRGAAEVGDKVESNPAYAVLVEIVEVVIVEGVIDHGHSGVATLTTLDGIDHRRVISPVAAGLNKDCP